MEVDADATDGVALDGDVDKERYGDDEEEEDQEEDDEDDDDGKEPQMIGQEEMTNTSADDVDTMVDNQPIVLPEQGEEMHEHTPLPQPPAPAPPPHTTEPRSRP